uniref:phosphoribosyl-AMP cyclohydrolase n=1 Tax=Parerythrobacter lutipelagi TaxID=1964208 RepID=UPI0010FA1BD2|nr:phosphoribosyl-AMP cyclohydrolase [Parerythrobacter lutipelagi]
MSQGIISPTEREEGTTFAPKFDSSGLLCAVVIDHASKDVLMVAYMNRDALELTLSTGFAHFYSRSRHSLWKKGETSGNTLSVQDIAVDCDQDTLILRVIPAGPSCHTGAQSCFYRVLENGTLRRVNN